MRALTVILLFSICSACHSQSHDVTLGRAQPGDVLLYKGEEWKYGFPLFIRTTLFEFPKPNTGNIAYISAIIIRDHYYDGTGGFASIKAGGVGQNFVKIELKSQRHHGFRFTISIYGQFLNRMY
nr:venom polypeptide precursor [Doratifera vulnerans]